MMRFGILISMLTAVALCHAAPGTIDLEQTYRQLDEAIARSDRYVAEREQRIQQYRSALEVSHDPQAQYELCRRLYDEYHPYINDSAIHYLGRSIDLSQRGGNLASADECRMLMAFQCTESGMYHEAADLLGVIDVNALDDTARNLYYSTMAHLYQELGYYCKVPQLQQQYYARSSDYNSRINLADTTTDEALQIKELQCYTAGDAQGALRYSDQRLRQVEEGSHDYAIVAFYRHLDYRLLGDTIQARYWVAQSALSDVRNAVMDQGAMWELASMLMADGDMDRAYRYIRFAWQCAVKFNTVKRNNQISPVLTDISDHYEASLKHANRLLQVLVIVASLLAALLLGLLFYSRNQRRKLARARNELFSSNAQLAQLNAELSDLNSRLSDTNAKLGESNRVKDEYVGRFIHLCSFYIDRLDALRRQVNKMVKSKDLNALLKFTGDSELRDKNLTELYEMFDSTFLHLFPNFVDDFNALLRPECRITLPEAGTLNTAVRIFALIRLGIEDSSRIAEFLHYSVNTIYNYRAQVKNGAQGNRDTFEAQVKNIGM